MPARTSQAGHRRFLQPPRSSSGGGRLPPHGAPWGPGAMHPWPPSTSPPSGSMHRWFPAVVLESPISVSKRQSNCRNLGGRRWVRTTGFSLVRRKQPTKRSSSQSRLHALDLRKPYPEMPRDAWESLHGGSRKWFPEQRPRSRQSGIEQRLRCRAGGRVGLPGSRRQRSASRRLRRCGDR